MNHILKIMVTLFTFGLMTLVSTSTFAAKDCNETGSLNGTECCATGRNVTCNNPHGPDRCYHISDDGKSACSANCSDHGCITGYNQPNPMHKKTAKQNERTPAGSASGSGSGTNKTKPKKKGVKAKRSGKKGKKGK